MTHTAHQIECLFRKHNARFNQYERDFMISITAMLYAEQTMTSRQMAFLETLLKKIEVWERLD
jgi:hypothetical protein